MINFDNLPDSFEGSNSLLEDGWYPFTIKKAEMRTSKSTGKEYLSVGMEHDGHFLYDNLMESDKPLLQFKLKQFIKALRLPLAGNFELKDLIKIIMNKSLMVCVNAPENPGYTKRNAVNAFEDGGYHPMEAEGTEDEDLPFSVADEGAVSY